MTEKEIIAGAEGVLGLSVDVIEVGIVVSFWFPLGENAVVASTGDEHGGEEDRGY